jgi:hypothetical protein
MNDEVAKVRKAIDHLNQEEASKHVTTLENLLAEAKRDLAEVKRRAPSYEDHESIEARYRAACAQEAANSRRLKALLRDVRAARHTIENCQNEVCSQLDAMSEAHMNWRKDQ